MDFYKNFSRNGRKVLHLETFIFLNAAFSNFKCNNMNTNCKPNDLSSKQGNIKDRKQSSKGSVHTHRIMMRKLLILLPATFIEHSKGTKEKNMM